jgi:hypothetical protein
MSEKQKQRKRNCWANPGEDSWKWLPEFFGTKDWFNQIGKPSTLIRQTNKSMFVATDILIAVLHRKIGSLDN